VTLINEIHNQLRFRHHLPDGAVTQAIAYVIFNTHASTLVNGGKVTREMAYEAALQVRSLAQDAAQLVAPARDLRTLVAHYISRSGGSGGVVKTEIHLYGSLAQCARRAIEIGRERGYISPGSIKFKVISAPAEE